MATGGAVIASAVVEGEATSAAVERAVDVLMQPIADMTRLAAATAVTPMSQRRVVARLMILPMLR
jgi:hypothetical protein